MSVKDHVKFVRVAHGMIPSIEYVIYRDDVVSVSVVRDFFKNCGFDDFTSITRLLDSVRPSLVIPRWTVQRWMFALLHIDATELLLPLEFLICIGVRGTCIPLQHY